MATTKAQIVFLLGLLSGLMMTFAILQLGWLRGPYSRGAEGEQHHLPLATRKDDHAAGHCTPCDVLFPKLKKSSGSGKKLVQRVEMQMRG